MELQINTPRWFLPLLSNARYKGAWGGRGSGKSHAIAEYVIERCLLKKTDVVCIREIQLSLQQSVKRLLELKIESFGASHLFQIQESRILAPHGGLIIFQGMQSHNADSIKSLESFDIAWAEEAQSLSQRSIDLLRPTMRKPGSELVFSWNPSKETDPIDKLLRGGDPPPDAIVVQANYMDNPWLPDVLRTEMEYDRRRDPDKYAHVWLGEYQRNSEARVFRNWEVKEFDAPKDAIHRMGADWGFSVDPSVLVRCHIVGNKLFVDYEAYQVGCDIVDLPSLFMTVPEAEKWAMTADSARPETISHMRKNGFPKIYPAVKGARSLEEGVQFLQSFDIVVHPRCKHTIDELTLYSYKLDPLTGKVMPVLADKDNHCLVAGTMIETAHGSKPIEDIQEGEMVMTRKGLRRVLFSGVTDVDRLVLEVKTSAGTVFCTPNHKIYTVNRGFVRADALRYNDEILPMKGDSSWLKRSSIGGRCIGAIRVVSAGLTGFITSVQLLAARFGCIAKFGKMLMGKYQKVCTSITKMVTPEITIYQTLNAYPRTNTLAIGMSGMTNEGRGRQNTLTAFGGLQKSGTEAKRVRPSTKRLGQWHTSPLFLSKKNASSASLYLPREKLGIKMIFAQTLASLHSVVQRARTMFKAFAHAAGKYLHQTNTESKRIAQPRVLTVCEAGVADKVYDLTIEGEPEFFANGILVHNCIDALRYACEGARRAGVNKPRPQIHTVQNWMG